MNLLSKRQALEKICSPKLLARLIRQALHEPQEATLRIVPGGPGRRTLIEAESLDRAIAEILAGKMPPRFPSEE